MFFAEANQECNSDLVLWLTHWYDETPNLTVLSTARAWAISNRTPMVVVSKKKNLTIFYLHSWALECSDSKCRRRALQDVCVEPL